MSPLAKPLEGLKPLIVPLCASIRQQDQISKNKSKSK